MEVTGFSLFTLCHNFGRRARAMMRSLANQVGCPVPVQVTIFYSRKEDAALIREGTPAWFKCELQQVPEDRIMQRAIHFSKAHQMHQLSHTVFFDSDLWFPPTFWSRFFLELSERPPGYYSCRVRNIPWPASEDQVNSWKTVSINTLRPLADGIRCDDKTGRVGHFQCVPRTMVTYPEDPRQTVEYVDLMFSNLAIEKSTTKELERRIGDFTAYHFDHPMVWAGTKGVQL